MHCELLTLVISLYRETICDFNNTAAIMTLRNWFGINQRTVEVYSGNLKTFRDKYLSTSSLKGNLREIHMYAAACQSGRWKCQFQCVDWRTNDLGLNYLAVKQLELIFFRPPIFVDWWYTGIGVNWESLLKYPWPIDLHVDSPYFFLRILSVSRRISNASSCHAARLELRDCLNIPIEWGILPTCTNLKCIGSLFLLL